MKRTLPFDPNKFTVWEPLNGWLILLVSKSNNMAGTLYLPEQVTKKANEGICIKCCEADEDFFLGKECFYSTHSEYKIGDSDTGYDVVVIEANKILMVREPSKEVLSFSTRKAEGLSFETLRGKPPAKAVA